MSNYFSFFFFHLCQSAPIFNVHLQCRKVISKYSLANAIANTTDDLKFSAVQYNHLMKVLEIANGDVEEGARLLGMTKAQLRRTARQLAKEGFDTSRIINEPPRQTASM